MGDGHMGHMFRRMNSQMDQMLNSMKSSMSSMMSKDPFQDMPSLGSGLPSLGSGSGGKMYIMESGPGFHEEKTYDIGPNGKMTRMTEAILLMRKLLKRMKLKYLSLRLNGILIN